MVPTVFALIAWKVFDKKLHVVSLGTHYFVLNKDGISYMCIAQLTLRIRFIDTLLVKIYTLVYNI